MSAVAATPAARPSARLIAPAPVVRLVAFGALALFAALRWATLEAPGGYGRMALGAALALAVAPLFARSGRLALAAQVAGLLVALVVVLPIAGVPTRLLAPAHWGDLTSGISQGLQTLPGIGIPYKGVDPWVRVVMLAGGVLLLVVAGALAMRALRRDRRPVGAALVLAVVYTTPVVERAPAHPYLSGIVLTLLAGALLWGDRLERAYLVPAVVFVALAIGGGAFAAPRLDASKPWIDYQHIIESLSTSPSVTYDWNHGYGPLHWPRDNRELLRISSRTPQYFKAVDLDDFDGVAWRANHDLPPKLDTELAPGHPSWYQTLRVTVRDLKSPAYVAAGTAVAVNRSPRYVLASAPGTFVTGSQPLRRGDSYLVDVYVPHPTSLQLAKAGSDYPSFTSDFLTMALPRAQGGPTYAQPRDAPRALGPVHVLFQQFGLISDPAVIDPLGDVHPHGDAIMRRSAYGPMYDLALRLRQGSTTPYQFVRAVQSRLSSGFGYTENPPRAPRGMPPLVWFMFHSHAGYCQQFSGAMALLLRMGGVPARVASGFTPGVYDSARREWVVHDTDAHSWVEAYFPHIGWVTFDPTPAIAPPHHQLAPIRSPDVRPSKLPRNTRRADVPNRARGAAPAIPGGRPVALWVVVVAVLGLAFAVGAAFVAIRARRNRPAVPIPPELAELHRALRLTGRPPEAGVTLHALEDRYRRHAPAAAAYIASVRLRRYGGRSDPPSRGQRRALRRELAEGLGFGGRLRAWFALPPGVH